MGPSQGMGLPGQPQPQQQQPQQQAQRGQNPSAAQLQAMLRTGRLPNGSPLTDQQRAQIMAQLKQRQQQVIPHSHYRL